MKPPGYGNLVQCPLPYEILSLIFARVDFGSQFCLALTCSDLYKRFRRWKGTAPVPLTTPTESGLLGYVLARDVGSALVGGPHMTYRHFLNEKHFIPVEEVEAWMDQ